MRPLKLFGRSLAEIAPSRLTSLIRTALLLRLPCAWDQLSNDANVVVKVARLAVADKERVEGARAAAAHAYYSQFTFQPVINEKSKQLVRVSALRILH